MIVPNESIEDAIDIDIEINDNIKKLCMLLNYDIVSILNFNNGNKIATSKKVLLRKNNGYISASEKWMKILDNSQKYTLNLVIKQKQISFYPSNDNKDNDSLPLIENIGREIYIPILSNNKVTNTIDLIACIYISTFDINKVIVMDEIAKDEISSIVRLLTKLCEINYLRYQKNESIFNLLNMMSEIILVTDPLTVLHPYAVASLSKKIADSLQLDEFTTKRIYFAGLLHDIGKMYIDAHILTKQAPLTHEEYTTLKNHSIYGSNIIKTMIDIDDISLFVKHHHERYDGKGYPDGLCSHEIPLESRIIGIADACDAMLSPRSYKSSRDINYVINELLKSSGTQFDSNLVDITINILSTTSEEVSAISNDYLLWSTLIITTRLGTYSIQGILIKYSFGYLFKSNKFNFLSIINKEEVLDAHIHIHKNHNQFFEFNVKLDAYEENQVYISDLTDIISHTLYVI